MKTILKDNGIFQLADAFVNQTNSNIFLTGKAGTGKTTFLQHIRENTIKDSVVVAPTGVAAINAGGVTIHSFFQLPIGTFIPEIKLNNFQGLARAVYSHGDLLQKVRINSQKRKLIRKMELLIIDEVSMVRADLLDAVDVILRFIRRNQHPFGGVQVLMIGDLYQLPPVVPEEEKQIISSYYGNPYFFSSRVLQKSPPVSIELDKIFRQSNEEFISFLNKIRHNQVNDEDLEWINRFYKPDYKPPASENYITLCSHHYKANAINERELEDLPGKLFRFESAVEGEFNENAAPADQILFLKKGAQVMFVKNDKGDEKRYYNGKIGVISEINNKEIRVSFAGEAKNFLLEREEWKNIRYSYDDDYGGILEKELGSFRQFPVRLAWAITIHKSQGLTFEKAILDAGDSFTSGQVYVAFSRLRSLDGLVLHTPIHRNSIKTDSLLLEQNRFGDIDQLRLILNEEQKKYINTILYQSLSWENFKDAFNEFLEEYDEKEVSYRDEAIGLARQCLEMGIELDNIAKKFEEQLSKIFAGGEQGYQLLKERMESATDFFTGKLKNEIDLLITTHFGKWEKKPRMKKYLKELNALRLVISNRIREIEQARDLARGLADGKNIPGLLTLISEHKNQNALQIDPVTSAKKLTKGDSKKLSLEMYREGKTVGEIAKERSLTKGTIESHLLHYILQGELDVNSLVSEKKYDAIHKALKNNSFDSLTELKHIMGDDFTYTEIRAVMNHLKSMKEGNQQIR